MDTAVDNAGDQCQPTELGHYHYNWMDITEDFTTACTDLKLGELMHDAKYVYSCFRATNVYVRWSKAMMFLFTNIL